MNAKAPKTTKHLDMLRRAVRHEIPAPPIATLIGFDMKSVELGQSVMTLKTDQRHANPMGTLHGGIICDVGDAAMGMAIASTLEDDESFTTLSLTSNFFKPVWNAEITATAQVTKRTRKIALVECDVTDEAGSLVAKLWSTCMVLSGEDAKGR